MFQPEGDDIFDGVWSKNSKLFKPQNLSHGQKASGNSDG
jgi:hypothetical protein